MDILGIGPLEFIFIIVIMLLVLGPKGMVKAVHDIGQFLRKLVQSPVWKSIINSSQEIREVQHQIIKETGLDESIKEIRASTQTINKMTNDLVKPALDQAKIDPISLNVPRTSSELSNTNSDNQSAPTPEKTIEIDAIPPENTLIDVVNPEAPDAAPVDKVGSEKNLE
jgi:sec-independent protein translocase protein TatB